MTRTIHVEKEVSKGVLDDLLEAVSVLLRQGKRVAITVSDGDERLSPQQAAVRLGFSRQHVRRLIEAGVLEAERLPGSRYWQIPLASVLRFEEERDRGQRETSAWSRDLDRMGAPAE